MTAPYRLGVLLMYAAPVFVGFFAFLPEHLVALGALLFLSGFFLRPFDLPHWSEFFTMTGLAILGWRVFWLIPTVALPVVASIVFATALGTPFRLVRENGEAVRDGLGFKLTWIADAENLLLVSLALWAAGFLLARLLRKRMDLFGSRTGIWSLLERWDLFASSRGSDRKRKDAIRPGLYASRITGPASAVMIRPWVLVGKSFEVRPIPDSVDHVRSAPHALRLAHMLRVATERGDQTAQAALDKLLAGPFGADIRQDETWSL